MRDCNEESLTCLYSIIQYRDDRARKCHQLYLCCEKDLGDAILKRHEYVVNLSEQELAVIPVSVVV